MVCYGTSPSLALFFRMFGVLSYRNNLLFLGTSNAAVGLYILMFVFKWRK